MVAHTRCNRDERIAVEKRASPTNPTPSTATRSGQLPLVSLGDDTALTSPP